MNKDAKTQQEERAIPHEQLCDDQAQIARLELQITELKMANKVLKQICTKLTEALHVLQILSR